ncbi:methyl-accepting chemotaxis protein [uncultured Roseobacter sp.]|uniref:methyl-accepting chemotaxis protein n=1 Tax=uncultured Roseobacter sp. TaxID=114847 RepID=UPI002610B7D3|nr:methyl-accepting chemotaxis protein [uncultured Roseobacter sp.]
MNMQSQITAPDAATLDTLPYRKAIDRVAMLRTLSMQIALNVSQLAADETSTRHGQLTSDLKDLSASLKTTAAVLSGEQTFDDLPEALGHWLASIAKQNTKEAHVIAHMADKADKLVQQALSGDGVEATDLASFISFAEDDFLSAVSRLTDRIWATIEDGRAEQLERAMQSAARLNEGLTRLERIGKYVRSMSINASVEASRAGEAGKGLAIIAQEFKTLAEEVQQLTVSAREDIESIESS